MIKEFINKSGIKKLELKSDGLVKELMKRQLILENGKVLIECKKRYFRPVEVNYLKANAKKAKKVFKLVTQNIYR